MEAMFSVNKTSFLGGIYELRARAYAYALDTPASRPMELTPDSGTIRAAKTTALRVAVDRASSVLVARFSSGKTPTYTLNEAIFSPSWRGAYVARQACDPGPAAVGSFPIDL